ncbi:MAG: antibiotic acetyltransferase [Bacillaceae bacterium]|nr:antibiotic acetyltransferase [Bacillaceae bacterium]
MIRKVYRIFEELLPELLITRIKYRRFLKNNCVIAKNVEIINGNLGKNIRVAHNASIRNSDILDYTSIGRYSKINHSTIGKFCSISWDVTIGALSHPINTVSTHSFPYTSRIGFVDKDNHNHKQTSLGNDVWVGCNSVILPGIKIGDGAIIGAGSVVTKDVPDYAIVAGVPAEIIRYRFEENIRQKLKEIKWWDLPYNTIKGNIYIFQEPLNEKTLKDLLNIKKL